MQRRGDSDWEGVPKDMRDPRDEWNPVPKSIRGGPTRVQTKLMMQRSVARSAGTQKILKLRRQYILVCRLFGMNTRQIAEKVNLGIRTVSHELRMAKKDGTLESLNERIMAELAPIAIDLYKKKMLTEDDAFVAKDVLKHLDRLTARQDAKEDQREGHMSISAYIQAKKQLPEGEVTIQQMLKGDAAKAYLEQGTLEPASPKDMEFLDDIVIEDPTHERD